MTPFDGDTRTDLPPPRPPADEDTIARAKLYRLTEEAIATFQGLATANRHPDQRKAKLIVRLSTELRKALDRRDVAERDARLADGRCKFTDRAVAEQQIIIDELRADLEQSRAATALLAAESFAKVETRVKPNELLVHERKTTPVKTPEEP